MRRSMRSLGIGVIYPVIHVRQSSPCGYALFRVSGTTSPWGASQYLEAMHGEIVAAHAPEQLQHRHVAECCALLASAEQVSPGWLRLNDLDCLRRERYAMLLARFHAAGRDAPDRLLQVDLLLRLAADDFTRAGRGQNQKLKRACSVPALAAQVLHEGRQLVVRKRGVMLTRFPVERRRQDLVQVAAPAGGVLATA